MPLPLAFGKHEAIRAPATSNGDAKGVTGERQNLESPTVGNVAAHSGPSHDTLPMEASQVKQGRRGKKAKKQSKNPDPVRIYATITAQ